MHTYIAAIALVLSLTAPIGGQETKPVPKDSMRVHVPGCTKGYVFTVGRVTADQPGNADLPEGMHLRMNGPKALMADIKNHEGSMIEITGVMKKGQYEPGVAIGGGVRISPGSGSPDGRPSSAVSSQIAIDVEGWRQIVGGCKR